jgi:DNA replication protein DnaC
VLALQPALRTRWLPAKRREIAAVDPVLKDVLRKLVGGRADWPLYLHGPPGTGKTCAALALLDYLLPWEGQFATAGELASRVIASYSTREAFSWSDFGPYRDAGVPPKPDNPSGKSGARLVVLDELGTRQNVTDTHYECVQRVLDLREGYPLVVVSNLGLRDIARVYDARIASRCEAGTVVELGGEDRRTIPGGG